MASGSGLAPFHISIRQPWFVIQSARRRALAAISVSAVIFAAGGVLDWFVTRRYLPPISLMLGGASIASAVGLLVFQLLTDIQERYQGMLERLRRIAELNHHVRNALQVIAYRYAADNIAAPAEVKDQIARIESALREISAALAERPNPSHPTKH